jgi:hypothetical protein
VGRSPRGASTKTHALPGTGPLAPPTPAEDRSAQLDRLLERAGVVPGQDPDRFKDIIRTIYTTDAAPNLSEAFGEGETEQSLRRAFALRRRDAELRAEDFMTLAPADPTDPTKAALFGVVSEKGSGRPLAYVVWDTCRSASGKNYDYLEYLCADTSKPSAKNLGTDILDAGSAFFREKGSEYTELEAAWVGRYRWAIDGFDFKDASEKAALVRNWNLFSRYFQLSPDELVFDRGQGRTEPFSLSAVQHTWDFASIKSTERRLTLKVSTNANEAPHQETLEVGKAFLLAYQNVHKRGATGTLGVPSYHATRPHDPESEGQQQRARYRASRAQPPAYSLAA